MEFAIRVCTRLLCYVSGMTRKFIKKKKKKRKKTSKTIMFCHLYCNNSKIDRRVHVLNKIKRPIHQRDFNLFFLGINIIALSLPQQSENVFWSHVLLEYTILVISCYITLFLLLSQFDYLCKNCLQLNMKLSELSPQRKSDFSVMSIQTNYCATGNICVETVCFRTKLSWDFCCVHREESNSEF